MVCRVAPKTSTIHQNGTNDRSTAEHQNVDYETALDMCGYGKLSRAALGACACAFFTTGVENCVMSYILPAATCELSLTTYQAGLVNMAFMSGGVASAFFWGIVGDVFGRRNILSLTLIANGLVTFAQSFVMDYRLLLVARSLNGFLIGGPSTLVFTYLSDLVGVKKRQLYLNIVGMCFVGAWLILPAMAWVVIPFNATARTILPIYSWRLYLALGSVPAFVAGIWMMFLPESPRLLADTKREDMALKLLEGIHRSNCGSGKELKVKSLITEDLFLPKSLSEEPNRTKELFVGVLKDLKTFVSKSYAMKSSLILFVFFANMAAGFGLNLWIPELLLRKQGRACNSSTNSEATRKLFSSINSTVWKEMAPVYEYLTKSEIKRVNASLYNKLMDETLGVTSDDCAGGSHMGDDIFISGLIVGACCVLGNACCAFLSGRSGAAGVRRAGGLCAFAAAAAAAALAATACSCAGDNRAAVAAAAALTAASLNGNVLLIRLLLHAVPAKLSGLAVCWGAWWGRAGGVASNLAVGVLLDYSCPAPFISVAALLLVSIGGIMMIKLEDDRTEEKEIEANQDKEKTVERYISTHM